MNVTETVVTLIKNWPTLYQSRADALKHIFTSAYWSWVDGRLVPNDASEIESEDTYLRPVDTNARPVDQLYVSKENLLATWRVDNAELLAQEDNLMQPTHDCIWLPDSYNRFMDMPEDVTPEWKKAAIETASMIFYMTSDAEKGTHEYSAHRKLVVFMRKQGMITEEAVSGRIAELEAELADLKGES